MSGLRMYDAVVVGAGPNGLAAAIALARQGRSVLVVEARETVGGGCRSAELTLPGFTHDVCSAIHPLAAGSPFLRKLPLRDFGLRWIEPPAALAHPLDDGTAVLLLRSVDATAARLGHDGAAYRRLMRPLVRDWSKFAPSILGPLNLPRHPFALARFGLPALLPAVTLANLAFRGEGARALFAGMAAHSMLPLETLGTSSAGLLLGVLGHVFGWPIPAGGSQRIADSMAGYLRSLGGEIVTGEAVESIEQLPPHRAVLFDLTPKQISRIAGDRLPGWYKKQLKRYRYGQGIFKLDIALDGPIPWKAPECTLSATVHLGGTLPEIAAGERAVWRGEHPERPFVLLAQPSLFDPSRAPDGKHTVWAYCHAPRGSTVDMTEQIEGQIERFAPGFRSRILARHSMNARDVQRYNANYIGGDINGGVQDLLQQFTRPTPAWRPYRTGSPGIYICSSSTPPGGGVHGLCGYFAATTAMRDGV